MFMTIDVKEDMHYIHLSPDEIIVTIKRLERRISERLPNRNLVKLAEQLRTIIAKADARACAFRKPNLWLRLTSGVLIVGMISFAVFIATHLVFKSASAWEVLEGIDAATAG